MKTELRIHGDNIVECERTLSMICDAFQQEAVLCESPIYRPRYSFDYNENQYLIELLSGHSRWGVDINKELLKNGGVLREGADSYITLVQGKKEKVILGIEYCSALPAGNNAWQRNGRALSTILSGVPYLYFAELGGVELDSATRQIKAPRFPNPMVPFSYLSLSQDSTKLCVPIYRPHPSITDNLYQQYEDIFGYETAATLLRKIIIGEAYCAEKRILLNKTLTLVQRLASNRRVKNTLLGEDWTNFLKSKNRSQWLQDNSNLKWTKSIAEKVKIPEEVRELLTKVVELDCLTIGASEIPICVVPKNKIGKLLSIFKDIYPNEKVELSDEKDLALVWITGYKPKGDDSRPDRGLCPLARMVLGDSVNLLAIVYGPAKQYTWKKLEKSPEELANTNGLWQSVVNLSEYIFAHSVNQDKPFFYKVPKKKIEKRRQVEIPKVEGVLNEFSEHDTDTALHQILSNSSLIECLCNPPGGDWSGIDLHDNGTIYRWTSLPRVSAVGGKRPDHVFQQVSMDGKLFISIESKGEGKDLEGKIGIKLVAYLKDLFEQVPTSIKEAHTHWRIYNGDTNFTEFQTVSVGAFIYKNDAELVIHLNRGSLDAVLAFEFGEESVLHLLANERARFLIEKIKESQRLIGRFKIKIH